MKNTTVWKAVEQPKVNDISSLKSDFESNISPMKIVTGPWRSTMFKEDVVNPIAHLNGASKMNKVLHDSSGF